MPTDLLELKQHLLETDAEFRDLSTVHGELEHRLQELESKHYLSEAEKLEEVQIKKRKLHLKDRMEDIVRRHRDAPEGTPARG